MTAPVRLKQNARATPIIPTLIAQTSPVLFAPRHKRFGPAERAICGETGLKNLTASSMGASVYQNGGDMNRYPYAWPASGFEV